MTMWKLGSCPRCGGDLFVENDADRKWYEQCLQCAYQRELRSLGESSKQSGKKAPVAAGLQEGEDAVCLY